MQKEDLLKMLRDAEMDDEAIKALLNECLADLEKKPDEEPKQPAAPEETDEEKMDRVFGF